MRRRFAQTVLLMLAVVPALCLLLLSDGMPQFGAFQDDGLYWLGAKSLAEGTGYRITSLPGEPWQTKYPPLYPFLLSFLWKLVPQFPENLGAAATLNWLFVPAFLFVAWRLFGRLGFNGPGRVALILLLGWSPAVAYLGSTLNADLPFACFLLVSLSLAEGLPSRQPGEWCAFAAGICGGCAFLTKTAAGPLILTVPLSFVLLRQRKQAVMFFCGMAPFIAWWATWVAAHRSPGNDTVTLYYTNYLGYYLRNFSLARMPSVIWKNSNGLLLGIGGLVTPTIGAAEWLKVLCRLVAVVSLFGVWRLARRGQAIQHICFAVAYILMLVFWHFPPNERFLIPVFPILLAGLAAELSFQGKAVVNFLRGNDPAQRALAGALSLVFAAVCITSAWKGAEAYLVYFPRFFQHEKQQLAEDRRLYAWISANTPEATAFLAYRDTGLALWTGRRAARLIVPPALFYDGSDLAASRFSDLLATGEQQRGITYLAISESDYSSDSPNRGLAFTRKLVEDCPGVFELAYHSPWVTLYKINRR